MTEKEDRGDGSYNKGMMYIQTEPIDADLTTVDTGSYPSVIIQFYAPDDEAEPLTVNVRASGLDHRQLISALELVMNGLKEGKRPDEAVAPDPSHN